MASLSKIDSLGIGEYVLRLAGEGKGSREIAELLNTVKGVKISYVSVNTWLKSVRKERAETTKAVVQDKIKATVPTDLDILESIRDQLNNYRLGKDENGDQITIKTSEKLLCIDRLNKVIDTRLKYSGADDKEEDRVIKITLDVDE
ncbi:hypothetical protein SPSIL_015070 [Sporomusa silvacetica DSM 10669]|uniref:Terminase small subunit n=1 Tax=Sporomusa silvacetica DSM 10669 TaxID=1123289 RepID=A0ABZ3IIU7_9FIRM|nr:hypothetical protein [Sporomusa silvacetica]OZC21569.1 hypothetical protein SPSIL_09800 [Sporomusa silvacetica DSM 10669]